jgi:hypothetical protein
MNDPVEQALNGKTHDEAPAYPHYAPSYDEAELEAAIEKGTRAWADVPDAVAWVREMRGDDDG